MKPIFSRRDFLGKAMVAGGAGILVPADASGFGTGSEYVPPPGIIEGFFNVKDFNARGEFVAFEGDNPVEVEIRDTCTLNIRFVNCAFWGPADQNVVSHSKGFLSFSDCFFSAHEKEGMDPLPLLEADGGKLQVRGCSFWGDRPDIKLNPSLEHAIISENTGSKGVRITNNIGDKAVIIHNEAPKKLLPEPITDHYYV